MDIVDGDVDVAVVVDVAERRAPSGVRCGDRSAEPLRDILEAAVPQIAIDDLPLPIAGFGFDLFDLRIDVAVHEKQVEPSVEIEIEEADAPSKPSRVQPD